MATVEETLDDVLYEVVDGQVVEKPPMAAYSGWLASYLLRVLGTFAFERQLGEVVTETLFRIDRDRNLQRRPDVAFVSTERWPRGQRIPFDAPFWDVVPDLAVEVNSPSNKERESLKKLREYFRAGVRRVWAVYPEVALIYVYASPTEVRILQRGDVLQDEELFPGFGLPLDSLFQDSDAPEAP